MSTGDAELVGAVAAQFGIGAGDIVEGIFRVVQEAGELGDPVKINRPGRAVPLFGDDDFGFPF